MWSLDKLGEVFGLGGKRDFGASSGQQRFLLRDYLEYPSYLTSHLIYRSYDEDRGLFLLEDGWEGFWFEVSPVVGINQHLEKNLRLFFSDELPDDTHIQFFLIASHKTQDLLDKWQKARDSDDENLEKLALYRAQFFKEKSEELKGDDILTRDFRIFISVSQRKPDHEKFLDFKKMLFSKMQAMGMSPSYLGPEDLIEFISDVVSPNFSNAPSKRKYNQWDSINNQAINPGRIDIDNDQIIYDKKAYTRVYNVDNYPEEYTLYQMVNLLGDKDALNIQGRFFMCYSISSTIGESKTSSILSKGVGIIKSAEQGHARLTNISEEARQWLPIIRGNNRFLHTSFFVGLTSTKEKIDYAEIGLTSIYNVQGFKLKRADFLHLPILLSILPMQSGYYLDDIIKLRLSTIRTSEEVEALLPVNAEWKGVPMQGVLFVARKGQLFNWNPFYKVGGGNYNVCIFGPSGSGKSVLLQEFASCMLAQNVKIFALDIGQSFKNLAHLLDADWIKFSSDMEISLNPFSRIKDLSDIDGEVFNCLVSVICSMCDAVGSPLRQAIVEKAIKSIKFKEHLSIDTVAKMLLEGEDKDARDLGHTLYPYTCEGRYGKFFSKMSNIDFKKPLTVFEFEEIKSNTAFLAVVLQIISMEILMQVLTGDRLSKFVLIVDEAWMILDYAAKFLGDLARTLRKYGGSLVTCVQGYEDFQKTPESKVIIDNSNWTLMLQQKREGIDAMSKYSVFDDILPLLKTVQFVPGKYSECLISTNGINVVGRLVLDPFSAKLYSTDASDFAFIKKMEKEGKSLEDAINLLLTKK